MTEKVAFIVDDNKANRDVLQMMLKTNQVTPISVETPRMIPQALKQVEQVDVVFLDLEFPNYNGLELVQSVRAHPQCQSAQIIAYTVHTSEVEAAREAGFDGFLGKPLSPHRFSELLGRILNGESVWEP